jgi:hypothetical protein
MGYVHHAEGPPPVAEVVRMLPILSDRAVGDTLHLADAYRETRTALLGLSGIALMHNLGLGSPASLMGVVVTVREALDRARDALVNPSGSRHEGVQRRAADLLTGITVLNELTDALGADGHTAIDPQALHAVRRLLVRTAVPDAGLRHFTSVSCAGYPSRHGHDHCRDDHHHDHGQDRRTRQAKEARR